MSVISMKQLLEAGVHFGHQTRRWNPKMKRFILRSGMASILSTFKKTVKEVGKAYYFVRDIAMDNKTVLCRYKSRLRNPSRRKQSECGMYYVSNRFGGGMLTNFKRSRAV